MNKIIIIAVFVFWASVSFFYANSLVKQNPTTSNNIVQTNTNTSSNGNTSSTLASDLPNHNNQNDCWLAINGKVYDVTDYIYSHPGGAGEIIKYCGQDATKGFTSKDKFIPQDHSADAYAMLANYYIGDLNTISASATGNSNTSSNTATNSQNNNPTSQNNSTPTPVPVSYTLTTAIVSQHNSPSDCWVTGNANVYNVTSYITSHPGGQANITAYCGADIQAAFDAQGHSADAHSILASYQIGTLGATVTADAVNNTPPPPANNTGGGHDDDEWDD